MKKGTIVLGLVLCMLFATALPALAATGDYIVAEEGDSVSGLSIAVDYAEATGTYGLTVSGLTTDSFYILLVLKSDSDTFALTSADQITYIDQSLSGSVDGEVAFDFIPRVVPLSSVWLCGGGNDPVKVAELLSQGVTVSGIATLQGGRADNSGISVTIASSTGSGYTSSTTTAADGSFRFSGVTVEDSYTITYRYTGYLTHRKSVTIGSENVVAPTVRLLGGDTDASGFVLGNDIANALSNYGKSSATWDTTYGPRCDLNASGFVLGDDISYILGNYGKGSQTD